MNVFPKIREVFDANWTTVLVGWEGFGVLSPWPDRWTEFLPLITIDEIVFYAEERLSFASDPERDLILKFQTPDLRSETREEIKNLLIPLSELAGGDHEVELRKWRLVLLEQVLEKIPKYPLYGLMALTEFWQSFGFPSDSPHEIQGRGNEITPEQYYQQENLTRLLRRHYVWIKDEKAVLKKPRSQEK